MQASHRSASRLHEMDFSSTMLVTVIVIATILVSLLGSGILYQIVGARQSARRYAPPGMMVDVEGQHLHLVCGGNGQPTVLFESGIAASSLSWARVLRDVARFTRACAYGERSTAVCSIPGSWTSAV